MYRREFLKGSGLGAAATMLPAAALATPAPATAAAAVDGAIKLTAATAWPDSAQGFSDQTQLLTHRIEAMTAGALKFDVRPGYAFSTAPVQDQSADAIIVSDHSNIGADPAFAYFAGLPGKMGMPRAAFETWLKAAGGQSLWDELAGEFGWKPFLVSHTGESAGLWSRAPILSFAGLRLNASGLAADVARGLGAETVNIARGQIAQRLSDGQIDAVEPESLTEAVALGLAGPGTHVLSEGISLRGGTTALYIRRTVWDRLPLNQQLAVEAGVSAHRETVVVQENAGNALMRQLLAAEHKFTFAPMPAHTQLAIDRISEAVVADLRSRSKMARRIAESCSGYSGHTGVA